MTASARKKPQQVEADSDSDSSEDEEKRRKESQKEWDDLARETRDATRLRIAAEQFSSGRRGSVVAYDDVETGDNADGERPAPLASPHSEDDAEEVSGPVSANGDAPDRPNGVVTAGAALRDRKRAGTKKTGAQKKRRIGEETAKTKAEDEEERFLQLRLKGEKKPKRIDASRIVSYYDFDSSGAMFREDADSQDVSHPRIEHAAPSASSGGGNFRSLLSRNVWDAEDGEDEG